MGSRLQDVLLVYALFGSSTYSEIVEQRNYTWGDLPLWPLLKPKASLWWKTIISLKKKKTVSTF